MQQLPSIYNAVISLLERSSGDCQKCTKQYFFSDHKIDTDLKISNTFHNTFPKQALKCDKYKGLFFPGKSIFN